VRRGRLYGLSGTLLAVGAPVGLILLRALQAGIPPDPDWALSEIERDPSLYLYLLASTATVFTVFGVALGRMADRLSDLSIRDPLTGLLNARALAERLADECARAMRYDAPLALLLIDVDGLKQLNDSMGHGAGDEALRHVASAVRSGSRVSDSASRWGGDEFAVIAPNTDVAAAGHLAERIRELAAHTPAPGATVTISVGVAVWDSGGGPCHPADLRSSADEALYRAKRAGGNRVRPAAAANGLALPVEPRAGDGGPAGPRQP